MCVQCNLSGDTAHTQKKKKKIEKLINTVLNSVFILHTCTLHNM